MTRPEFNIKLLEAVNPPWLDFTINHLATIDAFELLAMVWGCEANTLEADLRLFAKLKEEDKDGRHWKVLRSGTKQRLADELMKRPDYKTERYPGTNLQLRRKIGTAAREGAFATSDSPKNEIFKKYVSELTKKT